MPSGEKKIFLFWFGSIRLYISIASMLFASLIVALNDLNVSIYFFIFKIKSVISFRIPHFGQQSIKMSLCYRGQKMSREIYYNGLDCCCQIVELHHVLERFWLFEYPYLQVKVRKLPLVLLQKMPLRFGCVYSKPNASLADSHGVKYARALFGFCMYDHVKTSVGEV